LRSQKNIATYNDAISSVNQCLEVMNLSRDIDL